MPDDPILLRVARLDGDELALDGALARELLARERDPATRGAPHRIGAADVTELNRMGARSPAARWADLVDARLPWLRAIPPDLDLIEADDAAWEAAPGERLVADALRATLGPGRSVSVATKMLYLKRPRLFPMLDGLVAELLGGPVTAEAPGARADQAMRLVLHVRGEGRRNLDALAALQERLAVEGIRRSLVRILDAALWLSHPAAGLPGVRRRLGVGLLDEG
jgi:uncharacterized protein DUF6308